MHSGNKSSESLDITKNDQGAFMKLPWSFLIGYLKLQDIPFYFKILSIP